MGDFNPVRKEAILMALRHPGKCVRCAGALMRGEVGYWLPPALRARLGVRGNVLHATDHSCKCSDPYTRGYDD